MHNTTKRIIALVLVAFMVAACMAVGVSAAEPKVTVNVLTGSVEVSADALAKLADGNVQKHRLHAYRRRRCRCGSNC